MTSDVTMSESPVLQDMLRGLIDDGPPGAEIVAHTIERVLRESTQLRGLRREIITQTIMEQLAQRAEWVEQWLHVHATSYCQGRVICPDCAERFSPAATRRKERDRNRQGRRSKTGPRLRVAGK